MAPFLDDALIDPTVSRPMVRALYEANFSMIHCRTIRATRLPLSATSTPSGRLTSTRPAIVGDGCFRVYADVARSGQNALIAAAIRINPSSSFEQAREIARG